MYLKVVVLAIIATVVAKYDGPLAGGLPAAQFPAGISPQACPNYPNCANPAVAINQIQPQYQPESQPQPQYQPHPQYQQPQSQYQPQQQYNPAAQYQPPTQYSEELQNALDKGQYIGDGDYHGEGLAEALAPGYQRVVSPTPFGVPPQGGQGRQLSAVPAGVDARSCPNYPFCH